MNLPEALKETGVAGAYYDGKTISVREDENTDFEDTLVLSISDGAMPPYYQKEHKTLSQVEDDLKSSYYFPENLEWKPVETE